jgi:hypothetical protein
MVPGRGLKVWPLPCLRWSSRVRGDASVARIWTCEKGVVEQVISNNLIIEEGLVRQAVNRDGACSGHGFRYWDFNSKWCGKGISVESEVGFGKELESGIGPCIQAQTACCYMCRDV